MRKETGAQPTWFAGPITIAVTTAAGVVVVADSITQLAVVVLSASWPGNGAHGSLRSTQTQILVPVTEELVTREALSRDGCMVQGFQDCEWLGVKETPEVVSVHLPNKSPLEAVMVCIASFQTCRVLILVGDPIPVLVGKGCLIASILVPIQIVIQLTTSSRRQNGGAYCGAVVGGKCMVSKAKLVIYVFAM